MNMTREERELTVNLRIVKARRAYEEAKGNAAMKFWETAAKGGRTGFSFFHVGSRCKSLEGVVSRCKAL